MRREIELFRGAVGCPPGVLDFTFNIVLFTLPWLAFPFSQRAVLPLSLYLLLLQTEKGVCCSFQAGPCEGLGRGIKRGLAQVLKMDTGGTPEAAFPKEVSSGENVAVSSRFGAGFTSDALSLLVPVWQEREFI